MKDRTQVMKLRHGKTVGSAALGPIQLEGARKLEVSKTAYYLYLRGFLGL